MFTLARVSALILSVLVPSSKLSFYSSSVRSANGCSTPLLQDWLGDDQAKRFRREVHFPSGRFGEAIEQAHAVVFLASDESSFVNGTDFAVDGGLSKVSTSTSTKYCDASGR